MLTFVIVQHVLTCVKVLLLYVMCFAMVAHHLSLPDSQASKKDLAHRSRFGKGGAENMHFLIIHVAIFSG